MDIAKEKKWYVLRVVGGQENKIKKYIDNEIEKHNISSYISSVVVPTEKFFYVKAGKKVSKEKVSYPGYIMIEALLEGEVTHILKSIPGVVGFLSEKKGGEPIPMRDREISRMFGNLNDDAISHDNITNMMFEVGDHIKIIEGPFNSFDGVVENVNIDKMKVEVNVKIFGRRTPLELNFNQIEKIV